MKRKLFVLLGIALMVAGTYTSSPQTEKLAYEVGPPQLTQTASYDVPEPMGIIRNA